MTANQSLSIVLASGSPRRRELLQGLGMALSVRPANVDESALPDEAPVAMVRRLAVSKARAAALCGTNEALVIAADTIVVRNDTVLGKPRDPAEATAMLRSLRDRAHTVHTGMAVCLGNLLCSQVASSPVIMRAYSDAEIEAYVASGDPMDKAGAYACQNPIFNPVHHYGSCYANVMGLPVSRVWKALEELFGL